MVGASGFEPPTPTMSRWCSNQLSYAPAEGAGVYTFLPGNSIASIDKQAAIFASFPPQTGESTTIRNLQLPMRRDRPLCLSATVDTCFIHSREGTETLPYDNGSFVL